MTTRFHPNRFAKLIEAVRRAGDDAFNMSVWVAPVDPSNGCGTVACACGHYAMAHPDKFQVKPTMKLVFDSNGRSMSLGAWGDHFGITYAQADRLFSDTAYRNPSRSAVLDRLEAFYAHRVSAEETKGANQ